MIDARRSSPAPAEWTEAEVVAADATTGNIAVRFRGWGDAIQVIPKNELSTNVKALFADSQLWSSRDTDDVRIEARFGGKLYFSQTYSAVDHCSDNYLMNEGVVQEVEDDQVVEEEDNEEK